MASAPNESGYYSTPEQSRTEGVPDQQLLGTGLDSVALAWKYHSLNCVCRKTTTMSSTVTEQYERARREADEDIDPETHWERLLSFSADQEWDVSSMLEAIEDE